MTDLEDFMMLFGPEFKAYLQHKSIDLGVFSAKELKNTFDDYQCSYQRTWQIGAE